MLYMYQMNAISVLNPELINLFLIIQVVSPVPPPPPMLKSKVTPARPDTPTQSKRNTRLKQVFNRDVISLVSIGHTVLFILSVSESDCKQT